MTAAFRHRETVQVHKHLESITGGHDFRTVFDDFLTAVVSALSLGQLEERYTAAVKRYKNAPDVFARALGELVSAMERTQSDILGDLFEGAVSHGEHGQFFTPDEICRMMAQITDDGAGDSVHDPACGSGRTLLAAGRINPDRLFIGCDLDERCVKMTTINLALNGLRGRVVWGNSLSLEERGHYRTRHMGIPGAVCWSRGRVLTVPTGRDASAPKEKKVGAQVGLFAA